MRVYEQCQRGHMKGHVSNTILLTWDMENPKVGMVLEGEIDSSDEQQIVHKLDTQAVKQCYSICAISVDGNPAAL